MAAANEWLTRSDWNLRTSEFGRLYIDPWEGATMEFATPASSGVTVNEQLWKLWQGLPRSPVIIEAVEVGRLRYAAIDWTQPPIRVGADPKAHATIASYGIDIAQTFQFIARCKPRMVVLPDPEARSRR